MFKRNCSENIKHSFINFINNDRAHSVNLIHALWNFWIFFIFAEFLMLHQFSGGNWAIKSKKCWLFSIFANQILELTKVIYHFHITYRVDSLWYIVWVLPHWYCWDTRGTSKWLFFRIFEVFIFKSKLHPNNASYIKMFMMVKDC